jgi:aryl-alcohol dehydrogenase-like predicted oxidoreductase
MLVMGTASLPARQEALEMISYAKEHGITWFDTAEAYGDAEDILGESGMKDCHVITKLPAHRLNVREHLEGSLKRLKLERVDGYLLHNAKDQYDEVIVKGMCKVQSTGLTEKIGISIYELEDFDGMWDMIQFPFNLLDRKFEAVQGLVRRISMTGQRGYVKSKKGLFARQPFAKGRLIKTGRPIKELLDYSLHYFDNVVFGCDNLDQLKEVLS